MSGIGGMSDINDINDINDTSTPGPRSASRLLWAPRAWLGGRWRERVLLKIGADGCWADVQPDSPAPEGAERLPAAVLPGLVNAHSHAFQRAFVGLAERREGAHDDFWSWRERMYRVALRITPQQLHSVATHLYRELLAGGYTQVCEFHYLQHASDGSRYQEPAAMSMALIAAARDAGIGLTLLPVLYERAGFTQPALRADQRRFATRVQDVLALQRAAQVAGAGPLVSAGVAVHSLRAARPESIEQLAAACSGPIHIHVAEQMAEVQDCIAATGLRPLEWLAQHAALDARWQLVHATHSTGAEIEAVARSGAGVVLCPATEANLGDGLADLPGWLASGTPLSVGSDSQVVRAWPEELRWLEYGQRLQRRERNVAAAPRVEPRVEPGVEPGVEFGVEAAEPATAARLFERVLAGGAAAAGWQHAGLQRGARADLLLQNADDDALLGLPATHLLDGLVFAAPARPFARVMVAGRWCALHGAGADAARADYAATMQALWAAA